MSASGNILAFDSAGAACSAALWRDGAVVARQFEAMPRGQSERLMPMIEEVMAAAGQDYGGLEALAVTCGPGAFTGLRIGLAAAQGLALARGLPVIPLTSFEAHLAGALAGPIDAGEDTQRPAGSGSYLVALDAKRSDLYCQIFADEDHPLTPPQALAGDALAAHCPAGPILVIGDAADQAEAALSVRAGDLRRPQAGQSHADAGRFVGFAARHRGRAQPAASIQPLYLRPPDVTLPPARQGARGTV